MCLNSSSIYFTHRIECVRKLYFFTFVRLFPERVIHPVFCVEMCDVKGRAIVSLPCPETQDVYHSSPGG